MGRISGGITCFSNSKKIDFQNAHERANQVLIGALSGGNYLAFHGAIYGELTCHPVQAVLDDDVANWVGRFLEGVLVDDDTLAIDLINEVGPIPGFYLTTEHTRKGWRKEQFIPQLADREAYPDWLRKGKKDAFILAREKVDEILATHKPRPLSPGQDEAIDEILREARQYYSKQEST